MKAVLFRTKVVESFETRAWRNFADTYKTVYAYINSDLRHYGLTPPQYSVLLSIGKSSDGMLTMSEIGKQMVVTYANVTTVVDNLEKLGYVQRMRDETDRRRIRVKLTAVGTKIFQRIHAAHVKEVENIMAALDHKEIEDLILATDKLRKRIQFRKIEPVSFS